MKRMIKEWYGESPEISKDYCRIVSNKHLDRLQAMLSQTNGNVVFGGKTRPKDKFMEPTIVTGVGLNDSLMKVILAKL